MSHHFHTRCFSGADLLVRGRRPRRPSRVYCKQTKPCPSRMLTFNGAATESARHVWLWLACAVLLHVKFFAACADFIPAPDDRGPRKRTARASKRHCICTLPCLRLACVVGRVLYLRPIGNRPNSRRHPTR